MEIRIQPREIEIPESDPFKNDLLDRKDPAEILTRLVGSIKGPCALAIDAAWGNGKTTFLRMWSQHLRTQGFTVVKFNAWETDFSGNPFVALSTELTAGLQESADKQLAKQVANTKKAAKELIRRTAPGAVTTGIAFIPYIGPPLAPVVGKLVKNRLAAYEKAQESVKKFRNVLQDMADMVSKFSENRPLILVIDELDRCRPSYAVELLEVAKHLFSVDHIVFVLAVNRSELAHSINALYGAGFDAQGYLHRFFDLDFRLPDPARDTFIDQLLDATRTHDYLSGTEEKENWLEDVRKFLKVFFRTPELSLRRIEQAIHRLGLVFALLCPDSRQRTPFALLTVIALILRTIDSDLYHRFVRNEASDREVVDKMLNRPGTGTLKEADEILVETAIVMAAYELSGVDWESFHSPLLQRYQELVDAKEPSGGGISITTSGKTIYDAVKKAIIDAKESDPTSRGWDREYAKKVIERVENAREVLHSESKEIEFRYVVHLIELLSASLIDDPTTEHGN